MSTITGKRKSSSKTKPEDTAIANQGNQKLAVYSGVLDAGIVSPDTLSADSLINNSELVTSGGASADAKIAKLQRVQKGLLVQIEEQRTIQLGIKKETAIQKTVELGYNYSAQVSKVKGAKNRAEYLEERQEIQKGIYDDRLEILRGEKAKTGDAATRARSVREAYEALDVEYS